MFINTTDQEGFDSIYLKWKGWEDTFGVLKPSTAAYYDAEIKRTKLKRTKLKRTKLEASFPLRVLEVGFGNGSFLAFARLRGWSIVGLEKNPLLVDQALSQGFDARVSSDLTTFQEAEFDLVVAFDVIEHLEELEILSFMRDVHRVLRKSGRLIARVPNGDSPFSLKVHNGDFTHKTFLGSGKVRYLASSFNFMIEFLGGEAEPLFNTSLLHFSHRLLTLPLKIMIDFIVKLIYYPRDKASFCSANLTFIFQK